MKKDRIVRDEFTIARKHSELQNLNSQLQEKVQFLRKRSQNPEI